MNQPSGPGDRPSLTPVVLGFLFAGILLLVLGLWASRQQSRPPEQPPTITLISPAGDSAPSGTLSLTFETSLPIEPGPAGWAAGRYHLHALVDSVEVMPGAADIRNAGNRRYTWTGTFTAGVLQLVWARPDHSRVVGGASRALVLVSR